MKWVCHIYPIWRLTGFCPVNNERFIAVTDKKILCFALFFSLAGSVYAVPVWDNSSGDGLWGNALNWDTNVLPAAGEIPLLDTMPGATIQSAGHSVNSITLKNSQLDIIEGADISVSDRINIGHGSGNVGTCNLTGGRFGIRGDHYLMVGQSGGSGTFNMTGGTMTARFFWIARHTGGASVANFSGGETPNVSYILVGDAGDGTLNMNGGTLDGVGLAGSYFVIAQDAGSVGHVNLNAGVIETMDFQMGLGTASMDVEGGVLIIDGDEVTEIQGYIDSDLITAYDGRGVFNLDYNVTNDGKTTLSAEIPWEGKAIYPVPADGDICDNFLSWTGHPDANSYNVFISDSNSLVFSRGESVMINVVDNEVNDIAAAGFDLVSYRQYYWAVDCVKAGEDDLVGDIWKFIAGDPFNPRPTMNADVFFGYDRLEWTLPQGDGNVTCDVVFGTDPDMANNVRIVSDQPVESIPVTLTAGATHYWQLAVYDSNVSETVPYKYSPVYTFNVLERQMETLDRGMTVMNIGSGEVYIGWRMFKSDSSDVAFNIYRNSAKLNSSPITASTNFLDTGANLQQENIYEVRSVIGGQEKLPGAAFTLPADPPVVHNTGDTLDPAVHSSFPFTAAVGRSDTVDKIMVGDLDGDGKYDYVIKHPQGYYDPGAGHDPQEPIDETYKIAAFNNDGTFMWEVDLGYNIVMGTWWSPVLVYDLDGDGRAEVVAKTAPTDVDYRNEKGRVLTGPEWFTVFDGQTGEELATEDWIDRGNVCDWGDCYGNRVNREMMGIAYLDGVRPTLLIIRGLYQKMVLEAWNFNQDDTLELVWQWNRANNAGGGFHMIRTGDINGDGKEEIIHGSIAIDDDGITMWATGEGHGDDMCLTDIDPSRPGLEVFYIQEGGYTNALHLRDAETGDLIWGHGDTSYGDVGRGLVADIDPRYPGLECWTANATAGLFSSDGVRIAERPTYASSFVCERAYWWGPDLLRELSQGGRMFSYNYLTGSVSRIGTCNPKMAADIIGDWREELIYLSAGEIRVGTPMTVTSERFYTFMQDPIYRNDVAGSGSGYYQSPYTSFYVGTDMAPPSPDAMTWDVEPKPASTSSITMTATTATAYGHGGVEYFFDCVTGGGNDSRWQKSPTYTDTGLAPDKVYLYRVKARGLSHLETAYSSPADAALLAGDYNLDEKVLPDDLNILAANWLSICSDPNWCIDGQTIDMSYFSILASNWLINAE